MGIAGLDEHLLGAEELGKRARRFDVQELQKLLYDGRPVVRINTVNIAARVGPLDTLDLATLVTLLRDEDQRVRTATARALGTLAQEIEVCVPRLLKALVDAEGEEASAIIDAVMAYGDEAIPWMVAALDASTKDARRIVLRIAAYREDKLRQPLLEAMNNVESPVRIRENAAVLLRTLLKDDKAVIAAIEKYTESLKGPKPAPRELPPLTLPPERTLATRELPSEAFGTEILDDDAIGKLLGKDNKKLPDNEILSDGTYDGRAPVRANYARMAGLAGRDPGEDLRARLLVLLRDEDKRVRLAAARSVGELVKHIDPVEAVPRLLEVVGRFDGPEHDAAVQAVLNYGAKADPVLVRALDTATPWARQTVGVIAARRDDLMRKALLEAMAPRENPPRIRENAAELLKDNFKTDKKVSDAVKAYLDSLKGPQPEPRELPPLTVRPDRALPERALPSDDFATAILDDKALGKLASLDNQTLSDGTYDGRAPVRANFARMAGLAGKDPGEDLRARLLVLLRDEDKRVRLAAARSVGELVKHIDPVEAVPRLLEVVARFDGPEHDAAVQAILAYDDKADPVLVRALDTSTKHARHTVGVIAPRRKGLMREPLLAAMAPHDNPPRIRENAAELLKDNFKTSGEVSTAIKAYLDSLKGPQPEPRELPPLTVRADRALPERALPSAEFATEILADDALGKLTTPDNATLAEATYDGRVAVRANFARMAGLAGKNPGEDLRARLLVLLRDEDKRVRLAAARSAGELVKHIDPVEAVPRLLEVIGRFDGPEHDAAVQAVLNYGAKADPVLVRALDTATPWARQTVGVIAARRDDLMRKALLEAMAPRENPPRIRENAAELLKDNFKTDPDVSAAVKDYLESLKGPQPEPRELPPLTVRPDRALPEKVLPTPTFATILLDDAEVADLLGKGNKNMPTAELIAAGLHDGRAVVRANFARITGAAGDAPASHAVADNLLVLLRDGDNRVRLAATEAIARLVDHYDPARLVPRLLDVVVEQGHGRLAEQARNAVLAFGKRADDALLTALDASTAWVHGAVMDIAEKRFDDLRPALLEAMADKRRPFRARENAAEVLRTLAGFDTEVIDAVDEYEQSLKVERRRPELPPAVQKPSTARDAEPLPIEGFATKDLDAGTLKKSLEDLDVAYLERALNDGRAPMRINAARALGLLGDKGHAAVPTLAVRLLDEDIRVTITIANTLAELKAMADYVMPMLGRALIEAPAVTRPAILAATDAYGKDGAAALLAEFEKYPQRQHRAVTALARHKPEWYAALLGDFLDNKRLQLRERAALILLELGPDAAPARKQLMQALDETKGGLRVTAINVLAAIGKKDKKLTDWLLAHHDDVRTAVAVASRQAMRAFDIEIPEDEDDDEDDEDF